MSTEIYQHWQHITIEGSNAKQAFTATLQIQPYHYDKLVDCAIGIALAWPGLETDHECIQFLHGSGAQVFFLHVYSTNHDIVGVNISMSADGLTGGVQLDWKEFAYLIEILARTPHSARSA